MEKLIICANCGKEVPEEKSIFHELDNAGITWNNCYECEEHLSAHGDRPFIPPKEEGYFCATAGPGRMRNAKEVLQELIDKEQDLAKEEQVREFNEVISYFKGLMERHGIVAKIVSDNIDHKSFMDELNYRINSRSFSCIMVLNNRIWISTSSDDIVKLVLIDDRTTKKDLTTEVKARIFEVFQESEIATMKKKHKKELDLLRGTYESEIKTNMAPGETPPKFVPNRSRRL